MITSGIRFVRLPVLLRVLIYLGVNYLLIFLVQVITGFLHLKGEVVFNPILGVALLIFTRFILTIEGKSFKDIGCVTGNRQDNLYLLSGTMAGGLMLVISALSMQLLTGFHWVNNPGFRWYEVLTSFVTVFSSVFVQELAFRGYTFRLMLDKWGEWPAQLVTALLFGCMHINEGMHVNEILLAILNTGAGSLLFGLAVIKTKRLHLAVGIHFGWNYAQYLLPRHSSQNGHGILLVEAGNFDMSIFLWMAPYLTLMIIAFFVLRFGIKTSRQ
ncbi:CPBP family intramembrane glutamic endopeptidase [Chitinophaga tropicalis]|uniref:CPBP family intramembrane metalloprotease n=1 Tax=Chitinophaga tropicalis TaxID=2683588 RepID=A0A7K1U8H2_9BACT|nr:type II CAAX endopeptidase family protein [Chitinophaga tropicalis]MVT10661.1 CPBP family intramembrane metalloprotease [Chitinophaga tropicalis]